MRLAWYWYFTVFAAIVLFRLICLPDFISSPYFTPIGAAERIVGRNHPQITGFYGTQSASEPQNLTNGGK